MLSTLNSETSLADFVLNDSYFREIVSHTSPDSQSTCSRDDILSNSSLENLGLSAELDWGQISVLGDSLEQLVDNFDMPNPTPDNDTNPNMDSSSICSESLESISSTPLDSPTNPILHGPFLPSSFPPPPVLHSTTGLPVSLAAWNSSPFSLLQSTPCVGDKIQISRLPGRESKSVRIVTKAEKKLAHNAIERRYRNSINDRIVELKSILPFPKVPDSNVGKCNKANILRRAVDYIQFLQASNDKLKQENDSFRSALESVGVNPRDIQFAEASRDRDKDFSSGQDNSNFSDSSSEDNISHKGSSPNNGVRIMMFAFVVTTFIFNPVDTLGLLSPSYAPKSRVPGRVLLSMGAETQEASYTWSLSFLWILFWWLIRILFSIFCLGHLFINEPVHSVSHGNYGRAQQLRSKALGYAKAGDTAASIRYVTAALECLGKHLPTSNLDFCLSVLWEFTRAILHKMYVGLWLDIYFASRSESSKKIYCLASLLYLDLTRLYIISIREEPTLLIHLRNMNAILCSMNLAESVQTSLPSASLSEIYLTTALLSRMILYKLPFTTRYMMSDARAARNALFASQVDKSSNWLFKPQGYNFLTGFPPSLTRRLNFVDITSLANSFNPLIRLGRIYRFSLLESTFLSFHISKKSSHEIFSAFEEIAHLSMEAEDLFCVWWSYAGMAAVCTRSGEISKGIRYLKLAENLKLSQRSVAQDSFALALTCHFALKQKVYSLCFSALNTTTCALKEAVTLPIQEAFELNALLTSFTILIPARFQLWMELKKLKSENSMTPCETSSTTAPSSAPSPLAFFLTNMSVASHMDLNSLRRIANDSFPFYVAYVHLFQAILRCISCGNISKTLHVFEKCLLEAKKNNMEYVKAAALFHQSIHFSKSFSAEEQHLNLTIASSVFETLQCSELISCRAALKSITCNL